MKKILPITVLCLSLAVNLFAQDLEVLAASDSPYKNLREGKSHLITKSKIDEVISRYKDTEDLAVLKKIINDKTINSCASKVVTSISKELRLYSKEEIEYAILGLRLNDSIDDVAAGILIKAANIEGATTGLSGRNDLTSEEEKKALEVYKTKVADIQNKNLCIEDTFRELVNKLFASSKKFPKNLKHLNKLALSKKIIKAEDFKTIEQLRIGKVHEWPLSLGNYKNNLDSIAKAFPNRVKESAKMVTEGGKFRAKPSLRQSLHEKYTATQIIILANVVKSLKKRLDSIDVAVHINYVDEQSEIIDLSPMEKFRFILKLLRKELAIINNGSMLNGQRASYLDIITAAYEVGYISSVEIEQFAGLEDIWNPKKTTKEKIMSWVKMFGGISSVFLPPPFGFLSVMALMLIDQQISEAPVNPDADYNLL